MKVRFDSASAWLICVVGVMGCGDAKSPAEPAPIAQAPVAVNALAAGSNFTCMLTEAGEPYCWGRNNLGQLGTGDTVTTLVPRATAGGHRFMQITVGYFAVCGLTGDGAAYCWGDGTDGQLGDGTSTSTVVPVPVSGGIRFQSIGAGEEFACGLEATTGAAYCWGANRFGTLGTGDLVSRPIPTRVLGGLKFKQLKVGFWDACGIVDGSSTVMCWGYNLYGEIFSTKAIVTAPIFTSQLNSSPVVDITVGAGALCAQLTPSARYECWGNNGYGELGLGSSISGVTATPTGLAGSAALASVVVSKDELVSGASCGLTATGDAYCWGINVGGQLGKNASGPAACRSSLVFYQCTGTPVLIQSAYAFSAVSPGGAHVCGITRDHQVACWGIGAQGQLGAGTTTDSDTPTVISGALRTP